MTTKCKIIVYLEKSYCHQPSFSLAKRRCRWRPTRNITHKYSSNSVDGEQGWTNLENLSFWPIHDSLMYFMLPGLSDEFRMHDSARLYIIYRRWKINVHDNSTVSGNEHDRKNNPYGINLQITNRLTMRLAFQSLALNASRNDSFLCKILQIYPDLEILIY